MKKINTLTANPNQNIVIVLDGGTKVNLTLNYISNQQGWFSTFNYNNGQFIDNNRRIVTSPNMLSAFQNIIPFGISITITDGYEPIFIDDFVSGRASFYILNQADIALLQEAIANA